MSQLGRVSVRLTGIPFKHQGTHDSFCAYYAAATLLSALRPEFEDQFEAARIAKDPLFANYPRRPSERLAQLVARWITEGIYLDRLAESMNRACVRWGQPDITTVFEHRRVPRAPVTVAAIRCLVDQALPCLLSWHSREMGLHCVTVVGYELYPNAKVWFRVFDPARIQNLLEWNQLRRLADQPFDLVWPRCHTGIRPNRFVTRRDSSGRVLPWRQGDGVQRAALASAFGRAR